MIKGLEEIAKQLGSHSSTSFKRFPLGFSNDTYLVNNEEVLRVKKKTNDPFSSFESERNFLFSSYELGLTPKLLSYDISNGNMLLSYLKGYTHYLETPTIDDLIHTVSLIKKLHKSMVVCGSFEPFLRYEFYKKEAKVLETSIEEKQVVLKAKQVLKKLPLVPCHNDLVNGNLLKKDKDYKLIDFEFAGLNSPLFDLGSLLGENSLLDNRSIDLVLSSYFEKKNCPKEREDLLDILAFSNYLWLYWALMKKNQTNNQSFEDIAALKRKQIEQLKAL